MPVFWDLLHSGFPTKISYKFIIFLMHGLSPARLILLNLTPLMSGQTVQIMKLLTVQSSPSFLISAGSHSACYSLSHITIYIIPPSLLWHKVYTISFTLTDALISFKLVESLGNRLDNQETLSAFWHRKQTFLFSEVFRYGNRRS